MPRWADEPEEYSRRCEAAYRAGSKQALIRIIVFSALCKRPIPNWAADLLQVIDVFAVGGEFKSWDEVFGKPPSKHSAFQRHKWMLRGKVQAMVFGAHAKGRAIDDDLFEEIGLELGIGGRSEVKRLYAAAQEEFPLPQRRKTNPKIRR
jgi:hypothetical protein